MNKKKITIICIIILILLVSILLIYNFSNKKYYLELIGSDITLYIGEEYIEPGYKAYDNKGKDLTDKVKVEHRIDTNKVGSYFITYKYKDKILIRNVTIINPPNNENNEIYITLIGDSKQYIKKDSMYIESGAIATDSLGNDLTSKIAISGDVSLSIPDTYIITYSISDINGNIKKVERTVIVYELNYQYSKNCNNKECTINFTFNDNYYDKIIYPSGTNSKDKNINYKVNKNGIYKFTIYDIYGYTETKEIKITEIGNYPSSKPSSSNNPSSSTSQSKPSSNSSSKPSSSNIETKITNNLFVGDSRTVGMCKEFNICKTDEYIAKVSSRHTWFVDTAIPSINNKIKSKNYNIIILMGVNDASNTEAKGVTAANKYFSTISSLATTTWKNQNIIFVSVNPVIDGYSYTYTVGVNAFNKEIKSKILSSGISNLKYCDTNSKLNITTSNAPDGLHYNKTIYEQIYNIIKNECM